MSNVSKADPMRLIIREDFGKNLQLLREQVGLSQGDLAKKLNELCQSDYSRTNISKWERGTAFPPLNLLPVLSIALEVPLGAFFKSMENENVTVDDGDKNSPRARMQYLKREFNSDPHSAFLSLYGLLENTLSQLEHIQKEYDDLQDKQQRAIKIMNS